MKTIFKQNFIVPVISKWFKIKDYLSDYHEQSCCENVYIDFDDLDLYQSQINEFWYIKWITIKKVHWEWILVIFNTLSWLQFWEKNELSIFLACRNEQNWCYSDQLTLIIKMDWIETKVDLTKEGCIKDIIC